MHWHWRPTAFAAIITAMAVVPAPANAAGDPGKGESVFKVCRACHRVGPGARTILGPQLNGVVGRKAASLTGYAYSAAMKGSELTWDDATLAQLLRSPRAFVPGTRMTFAGIRKDEDIADVIAYLKTFDANGNPAPAPAPAQ
jgi:cytochrome c